MCTYCGTAKYRKIYENHYGPIPKDTFGRSYEIHHIDGNHNNNNPDNLKAVTVQEHYDIHYANGDWNACLYIKSQRLEHTPDEISELARKQNIERVERGIHQFLGGKVQRKRIADGTHNFLGDINPIYQQIKDGKNKLVGGQIQREYNAKRLADGTHSFLDSEKQRAKALKQKTEGNHPFYIKWKCEFCSKMGTGLPSYKRYHGDNCKRKSPSIALGLLLIPPNGVL